ncbi:MAG TPA: V-type ATPase 116kDa subunit family protein [Thermoplasmata archaeon]|nr:V-type ATPase 116kDa subunit family protein [Thermoplasmata archaeon]
MAVARLTKVTVRAPPAELGVLIARLIEFERFHPSRREGLLQDISIVLLSSRAQSTYGWATELLASPAFDGVDLPRSPPAEFTAHDVDELLREFEEDLEVLDRNIPLLRSTEDRRTFAGMLRQIQSASLTLFHAMERLLVLPADDRAVSIEGYIPTDARDRFRSLLGPFLVAEVPVVRRQREDPYVPTLLVNPRVISLFERFTLQRGIPRYSEIDPTPIIALVFPVFFAIMFGDLGHGITLLAVGAYLAARTRYAYWGQLLMVFGVVCAAVGVARGVFFGVTFSTPLSGYFAIHPAFNATLTLSYIPLLIEFAILIGTFHLSSAYAIAIVNQLRSGDYAEAAVKGAPTLVLYASLVPFGLAVLGTGLRPQVLFISAAPTPFFREFLGLSLPVGDVAAVTLPLIIGSFAVLVTGPAMVRYYRSGSVRRALRQLRDGLMEAVARPVEFVMNTLSYIRLAALLITNTLLGGLVAGVLAFGWVGVALAAFLNVLLMAMEGFIVYLQDMRLHLYEWFSKFYSGTGTAFSPIVSREGAVAIHWV